MTMTFRSRFAIAALVAALAWVPCVALAQQPASGAIQIGQGAALPIWQPMTGDCTLAPGGHITCGAAQLASFFVGSVTAGSANAQTIAAPAPTGFTLTSGYTVCAKAGFTNTGPTTLAVNATTATAINRRSTSGLTALVGGEIKTGLSYCWQYDGTVFQQIVGTPGAVEQKAIDYVGLPTDNGDIYVFTAAKTFTLPQSTTVPNNWTIHIIAQGGNVTVAPNVADAINGGTVGASVTVASGASTLVTTDGAGNYYVPVLTTGSGTVVAGTAGQFAYYAGSGTAVSGLSSGTITSSPTITGNVTLNPTSGNGLSITTAASSTNQAIITNQTGLNSGSISSNFGYSSLVVTNDGLAATAGNIVSSGVSLVVSTGGSNSSGTKVGYYSLLSHNTASAPGATRDHIAAQSTCISNVSDGGTNTGAGAVGTCFGGNSSAALLSGGLNHVEVAGWECDSAINTGASSKWRVGCGAIALGNLTGAAVDTAFEVGTFATSWLAALTLNDGHGAQAVAAAGSVITSNNSTSSGQSAVNIANFVNLPLINFTTYFNLKNLQITGAGAITDTNYGLGLIHSSAGGVFTSSAVNLATADVTGTLSGANGGTGLGAAAVGDLIYASATTPVWSRLADVATGSVLVSGGVTTAPAWSASPTIGTSVTSPFFNATALASGYKINGVVTLNFNDVGGGTIYTQINDPDGVAKFFFGNSADNKAYHRAAISLFQNAGGTVNWLSVQASGTAISDGINTSTIKSTNILAGGTVSIPAGGTAGVGYMLSSTTNFGIFYGSGVPTLAAAKGSIYLRSDGSSVSTRMYVNTDGGTTWTNVTTGA